jgi:hypothetical protein
MMATIPSAFIFTKSTFSLWWERSTTTLMGLPATADLFRFFVIVLVSRLAFVDSKGLTSWRPVNPLTRPQARSALGPALHGIIPLGAPFHVRVSRMGELQAELGPVINAFDPWDAIAIRTIHCNGSRGRTGGDPALGGKGQTSNH